MPVFASSNGESHPIFSELDVNTFNVVQQYQTVEVFNENTVASTTQNIHRHIGTISRQQRADRVERLQLLTMTGQSEGMAMS